MVAYTVKIELGDPSGDGHCISQTKLFKTNYDKSHLVQAYRVSVAKFGVDLLDDYHQRRFLLSYFYFDGLKELYPNCKIEKKITIMGTEYIIMNY